MGEELVKIDYTTTVPEKVIGHCCYHKKCVWAVHPIRIEMFSVKLMYREMLGVDVFRKFIDIPKSRETREGQKFTAELYRAASRYALLRSAGVAHKEAMDAIFMLLPAGLRGNAKAYLYFEKTVQRLVDHAEAIVEANIQKAPGTGWSLLRDETYTLEPLFFPAAYMPRVLAYAMNLPRIYTELVFCDEKRCYPAPGGIWPNDKWLYAVGQSLRHDVYYYFIENFAATNIMDYLTNLDIDEVAVSIKPGRRRSKIILYVLVSKPEEHVVKVARMQELSERVVEQLENLIIYDLRKPDIMNGLSVLGIDEDDIYRVVRKIYGKK